MLTITRRMLLPFPTLTVSVNHASGRSYSARPLTASLRRRQYDGSPAKSGPPVPNSQKRGRRAFYSLEQARRGGRRSGEARRRKAEKKWLEVCTLPRRGFGVRQIARAVGFTAGWVSQLVRRLLPGSGRRLANTITTNHRPPTPRPVRPTGRRLRGPRSLPVPPA